MATTLFSLTSLPGVTKRPLYFHLNSSEQSETPKCSIQTTKTEDVSMTAIPAEIVKNTQLNFSADPIHIHLDWKNTFNITIIDTPGLPFDVNSDEYTQVCFI